MKPFLTWTAALALSGATLLADAVPAGQPLTTILANVEKGGYRDVTEVSVDDGEWEVEALRDGQPVGLRIVPQTGEIRSVHADEPHPALPREALPLPEILKKLDAAGYRQVSKLELEPAGWEVECWKGGTERDLLVDLRTGQVLSDRVDD